MALPWILIQYGTDGEAPGGNGTVAGPPPWVLIRYGTSGDATPAVETPPPRGGASYLTRKEMRELVRRQRKLDKKQREAERALDASVREAYEEIKNPGLKARVAGSVKEAADELEDEEALLTLVLHHLGTRH